ncbi:MAG: hypothetical protein QOE09_3123 [Ilumatobacteraceae bacterium]|jgi:hypothetical protein
MSTTFHPERRDADLLGMDVTCCRGNHSELVSFNGHLAASAYYETALAAGIVGQQCCSIVPRWSVSDELHVDVSSGNTGTILDALGFTDSDGSVPWGGVCEAADFKGRLLLAAALVGRNPGYLTGRFERLETLARWCEAHGRAVCWY